MSQARQPDGLIGNLRFYSNFTTFLARLMALPPFVLLHQQHGSRFFGFAGVLALLPIAIISASSHYSAVPLTTLVVAYLARSMWVRGQHAYCWARGRRPKMHTMYAGKPWLAKLLPNWSDLSILRLEVVIVFALGCLTWRFNHPFGGYLVFAALGQAINIGLEVARNRRNDDDDWDALLEQRARAEQMQNIRED